jgi:hypothetical protein
LFVLAWATLGSAGWNWDGKHNSNWSFGFSTHTFAGLLPYMKAAEDFTNTDPFRNYSNSVNAGIYPSQGTVGTITAGYNSTHGFIWTAYFGNLIPKL